MEFSNLKIADWKCGDSSETWGGNGNQDCTRSCVSWKNKPSVWRDVGAAAISSDIIYRSGKDGFPQGNIICKLKKNEYKKWDWFFFLNSRFFSFYFTVLSCSNLMLMSLSLGLSTLVFLATLGTLNCCVFRQQPDLMWSLILGLLALPGSPTRSCDLFSALYLCSFLLLHVPWETSFCLLSYFLVIFKVLPWRAQVPEMGCHWMEVAIAALGLLRSRTE